LKKLNKINKDESYYKRAIFSTADFYNISPFCFSKKINIEDVESISFLIGNKVIEFSRCDDAVIDLGFDIDNHLNSKNINDLKVEYRELMKKYHPDLYKNKDA